jgi:hypothetical protein
MDPAMETTCSGCGLAVPGGTPACRAIFDDYIAGEWNNPISYRYHRMFVDTYCLQHPDQFCVSAKSFAAHLTGLCAAFEHKSHPSVLKAVNRWLNGNPSLTKPVLPAFRGAHTIAVVQAKAQTEVQTEVQAAAPQAEQNPFPIAQAIDRWARSTWEAYSSLHPQARLWINQSFPAK